MRGAEDLIAMRMERKAPAVVYADCDESGRVMSRATSLWIEPSDNVRRLDLRCVVGLPVVVSGSDAERVADVAAAMRRAGCRWTRSYVVSTTGRGEFTQWHAEETWPKF